MAADTVFARIIRHEIPARIVHEDEHCVAFHDVNPQAPTHVLVVPKEPLTNLAAAEPRHAPLLAHLMLVCQKVARDLGLTNGYRVVANCGPDGGQSVDHLHLHVLGGRALGWPPG